MGAPIPGMESAGQAGAHALADTFRTLDGNARARHEAVLDYWLSIRGNRELPPLRDLDPLELSDAAPWSVLLELVGGGEDGDIRHLGEKLRTGTQVDKIASARRPSVLASIARKLSIVAISRNFLAFEDEFSEGGFTTRCWITMLPLSSAGAWVDYVYAFVTVETVEGEVAEPVETEAIEHALLVEAEEPVAEAVEDVLELDSPVEEPEQIEVAEEPQEVVSEAETPSELVAAEEEEPVPAPIEDAPANASSFSFDPSSGGFYAKAVKVKPTLPTAIAPDVEPAPVNHPEPTLEEAAAEEIDLVAGIEEPEVVQEEIQAPAAAKEEAEAVAENQPKRSTPQAEGTLQSKLTDVRAKADEARAAKLRANAALYEGLGAAYDFALDAEESPEEYLKLVEAKGLKIQLRSPMRPVVKLAFEGMCDESTIAQLERVLAWALDQELPRGTLAQRIEEEGGLGPILNGLAQAA